MYRKAILFSIILQMYLEKNMPFYLSIFFLTQGFLTVFQNLYHLSLSFIIDECKKKKNWHLLLVKLQWKGQQLKLLIPLRNSEGDDKAGSPVLRKACVQSLWNQLKTAWMFASGGVIRKLSSGPRVESSVCVSWDLKAWETCEITGTQKEEDKAV